MRRARIFSTALLLLVVGTGATAHAQGKPEKKPAPPAPATAKGQQHAKASPAARADKQAPPAHAQPAVQHQRPQAPPAAHVRKVAPQPAQARKPASQVAQQRRPAPQVAHARKPAPPPAQARRPAPPAPFPAAVQRQRAQAEQQRTTQYRLRLNQQVLFAQRQSAQLQQQKRSNQYRAEQQYLAQLRQQQMRLQTARNYSNDPYVLTAPSYRYNYGGVSRQTNQYGADILRQAVNYGYQEGVRFGQADRQDGWQANYQTSPAYQDANYGYGGNYVDQSEYNYYFRQGFRRGYADGYNSQSQYGSSLNGSSSILANLLTSILGLTSLR